MFKIKSPDGEDRLLNPEEVQAKVLETLKKSATNKLKIPENQKMNCVITVPAYFNDSQKQSTMQAAKIAGLECQAIINEPTAAAIAFTCQVDQENEGPRKLCIFDFGGGTFDVSILTITNRKIEVKAIEGDNQLGGQDIDHQLCTHMIEKIKEENDGLDISKGKNGKKNVQKLREQCSEAKKMLTNCYETEINVENLLGSDEDFFYTLTRNEFELVCKPIFDSLIPPVEKALEIAQIPKSEIDDIVLVGGSTRIPGVQNRVQNFFDNKELNKQIKVDEAVCEGATYYAAMRNPNGNFENQFDFTDCTAMDFSTDAGDDDVSVLISRSTTFPCSKTIKYKTTEDNQPFMSIEVLQGNFEKASECHKIAEMKLEGIPEGPAGSQKIKLTYAIDINGVLKVTAKSESRSNIVQELSI